MQSLADIRRILEARGLAPRKSFGQNFLLDHNLIRKLVDASGVGAGDVVLEVGPGTGALTEELLARGCRVVAAEIDRGLCEHLRAHFAVQAGTGQFTLIEGDCLADKRTLAPPIINALGPGPFTLVANLPYAAATPVMSILLTAHPGCRGLFVTIQREVADRLRAAPGSKDYGTLSIIAQVAAEVRSVAALPPECFWPRPEVTSAMVGLVRRPAPLVPDVRRFADFSQSLFAQRRKQLGAILGRHLPWPEGIDPTDRAEALSIPQLMALFHAIPPGDRPQPD